MGGTRTADPGQLGERLAGLTRGTCLTAAPGTGPDLPPKHPVCAEPERRHLAGGRHVRRGEGTPRRALERLFILKALRKPGPSSRDEAASGEIPGLQRGSVIFYF